MTTKAAPLSGGIAFKNALKQSNAPADPPMPTTGMPGARSGVMLSSSETGFEGEYASEDEGMANGCPLPVSVFFPWLLFGRFTSLTLPSIPLSRVDQGHADLATYPATGNGEPKAYRFPSVSRNESIICNRSASYAANVSCSRPDVKLQYNVVHFSVQERFPADWNLSTGYADIIHTPNAG
jgi:hypothetical protein